MVFSRGRGFHPIKKFLHAIPVNHGRIGFAKKAIKPLGDLHIMVERLWFDMNARLFIFFEPLDQIITYAIGVRG